MSQRQAPYTTTPAFPEPNYTQTPNNFFDMLPDMEASEIIVTLIMIRNTFGFHRTEFKMGIGKLEDATGLSRNAVKAGAEAAEKRGTFRRTNPDESTEAEWELVVGQSVTPLNERPGVGQSVTEEESTNDPQVRVKERIKKVKDIKEGASAAQKPETPKEVQLYRTVTKKFPPSPNYDDVVSKIQAVRARLGRDVTPEDLRPAYVAWTGCGWNQFSINWLDYSVRGTLPTARRTQVNNTEPKIFDGVRQFLEGMSNVNA